MAFTEDDLGRLGLVKQSDGSYKKGSKPVEQKPVGNKKVRGAIKIDYDGIRFDSKLEVSMYQMLKVAGIKFELKPLFLLQPEYLYMGKIVKAITWEPDYLINEKTIIDTKGHRTDTFDLRLKMFKYQAWQTGREYEIFLPSDKKECYEVLNEIIKNKP